MRHGPYQLRSANGQVLEEGGYADGEKTGPWRTRFDDGSRAEEGAYLAGKKEGTWTRWDPTGRQVQQDHFRAGTLDGLRVYSPDATHTSVECYVAGAIVWTNDGASATDRPCPPR